MKPAPKRRVLPEHTPLLSRSETIRMCIMFFVLLVVLGAMLNLRATWKTAGKSQPAPGSSGVNVAPTYVVPARTPPETTTGQADPDPPRPRLSDDQEISYQLNRDEVLEAFADLAPVARNATWWTLAARVQAFGYPVLSCLTPKGPDLARCLQDPDACRGDVIRFKAKILGSDRIAPPPDCKGAPPVHVVRVRVDLPGGPSREAVVDVPAETLPSPLPEETALAGIFVGFLPAADAPASPTPAEVTAEEASAKGRPYLIGLLATGTPAAAPVPPPVAAPGTPATAESPAAVAPPSGPTQPPPAVAAPTAPPPAGGAAPVVRFEGMLGRIQHDGKYVQDEAYNYFIRAVTTTDTATIRKQVNPALTAGALIADPQARSGEFVRIRGTLLRIDHQGLDTNPANLRDSYLAYVLDRDENVTIVHLFLKKPPTYTPREDVFEADGLFLKLIHYETDKTSKDRDWRLVRKSPLVLANDACYRIRPGVVPSSGELDAVRIFLMIAVGGLFLAGGAWVWLKKQDRSFKEVLDEARKQKARETSAGKKETPAPATTPDTAVAPPPPAVPPPAPDAGSAPPRPEAPPPAPGGPPPPPPSPAP